MKLIRFTTLAIGATAISGGAFAQGLPTTKILTIEVAHTIATEALAKCHADGFKTSVTVVDGANVLKAFLRDDGASMAGVEIGRMKANAVMKFGRPSGPPANLAPGAPLPPPIIPETINAQGGVPIKVGDQIIGAVSVSGAPGGDKDAACAEAGIAKVADRLK